MKGREVRSIRKRLRLTQVELATRLGVTRITVLRWEAEQTPVSGPAVAALRLMAGVRRGGGGGA